MEGCPKVLMISYDTKEPTTADFATPVSNYIRDFYQENPESYKNELQQINQLKKSISSVTRDNQGCSTYRRYFAQLQFMQSRFPMSLGGAAAIPFTWYDVYSGDPVTHKDVRFEQAGTLFNLGGLYSQLGANESRTTDESMKVACTYFQCAAGAFQYLKENFSLEFDMGSEILKLKSTIMLGQAQECLLEKSIRDNRKNTLIARISMQIKDYFQEAVKSLESNETSEMGSSLKKSWMKYLQMKINLYCVIAYTYMSNESDQDQKFGEKVAYLKAAAEKINEAMKLAKNQPEQVTETLKFVQDVVGNKLEAAVKENDFVYHSMVPEFDKLPEIKGVCLVKAMPFQYNDPSVSGPDIFQRLIPMRAHEASSLYSEEKAGLLRKIAAEIEDKDLHLSESLTSMHIDDLMNPVDESLPDNLRQKCKELRDMDDVVGSTASQIKELAMLSEEFEATFNSISSKLKSEEEFEREAKIGDGDRGISKELEGLKSEFTQCNDANEQARSTNVTLCNHFEEGKGLIELLTGPEDRIIASLPSQNFVEAPIDEPVVQRIRELLGAVEKMKSQRKDIEHRFREQLNKDDITGLLVIKEDGNREEFFKEQLKKHEDMIAIIRQNLSAQDNILLQLTEANAKYAPTRVAAVEIASRRDAQIQSYMAHATLFLEVRERLGRGLAFYKDLKETLSKLSKKVDEFCQKREKDKAKFMELKKKEAPPPSRPTAAKPTFDRASKPKGAQQGPPPLQDQQFIPQSPNMPPMQFQNIPPGMQIPQVPHQERPVSSQGFQPQNLPSQNLPSQNLPSQNLPHQSIPPGSPAHQNIQPHNIPPQGIPPKNLPPQRMITPSSFPGARLPQASQPLPPFSQPAITGTQPRLPQPNLTENMQPRFSSRGPSDNLRPRFDMSAQGEQPPQPMLPAADSTMLSQARFSSAGQQANTQTRFSQPGLPTGLTQIRGGPVSASREPAPGSFMQPANRQPIPPQGQQMLPRIPHQSFEPQQQPVTSQFLADMNQQQMRAAAILDQHKSKVGALPRVPQQYEPRNFDPNARPQQGQIMDPHRAMFSPQQQPQQRQHQPQQPQQQPIRPQENIRQPFTSPRQPVSMQPRMGMEQPRFHGQVPMQPPTEMGMGQPRQEIRPQFPPMQNVDHSPRQFTVQQFPRQAVPISQQYGLPKPMQATLEQPMHERAMQAQMTAQQIRGSQMMGQASAGAFTQSVAGQGYMARPSSSQLGSTTMITNMMPQSGQQQFGGMQPPNSGQYAMQQPMQPMRKLPEPLIPEKLPQSSAEHLLDRQDMSALNLSSDITRNLGSSEQNVNLYPHGFQKQQNDRHSLLPMHDGPGGDRGQGTMTVATFTSAVEQASSVPIVAQNQEFPGRTGGGENSHFNAMSSVRRGDRRSSDSQGLMHDTELNRRLSRDVEAPSIQTGIDPSRRGSNQGSLIQNQYAFQGPISSPNPDRNVPPARLTEALESPLVLQQQQPQAPSQPMGTLNRTQLPPGGPPSAPPMSVTTQPSAMYNRPPPFSPNQPFAPNPPFDLITMNNRPVMAVSRSTDAVVAGILGNQATTGQKDSQQEMMQMGFQQFQIQQMILQQQQLISMIQNQQSQQKAEETVQIEKLQKQILDQQKVIEQLANEQHKLSEQKPHLVSSSHDKSQELLEMQLKQQQEQLFNQNEQMRQQQLLLQQLQEAKSQIQVLSRKNEDSLKWEFSSQKSGEIERSIESDKRKEEESVKKDLGKDEGENIGKAGVQMNNAVTGYAVDAARTVSTNVIDSKINTAESSNGASKNASESNEKGLSGNEAAATGKPDPLKTNTADVMSAFDLSYPSMLPTSSAENTPSSKFDDGSVPETSVSGASDGGQSKRIVSPEIKELDLSVEADGQLLADLDKFEEEMHAVLAGDVANILTTPTKKDMDPTSISSRDAAVAGRLENLIVEPKDDSSTSKDGREQATSGTISSPNSENSPPFYEPMLDAEQKLKQLTIAPNAANEQDETERQELDASEKALPSVDLSVESMLSKDLASMNLGEDGNGLADKSTDSGHNEHDNIAVDPKSSANALATRSMVPAGSSDLSALLKLPDYPSFTKEVETNRHDTEQKDTNLPDANTNDDLGQSKSQSSEIASSSDNTSPIEIPVVKEPEAMEENASPSRPHLDRQAGRLSFYQFADSGEERKAYLADLDAAVEHMHQQCMELCKRIPGMNLDGFTQMWNDLAQVEELDSCAFTADAGKNNVNKNRYRDILPWDHTRVLLKSLPSDYINASHVDNLTPFSPKYIASQGPIPQCFIDFWAMVWEQRCPVIVMLTNEVEGNKLKCHPYWPRKLEQNVEYGDISVYLSEQEAGASWKCRTFLVTNLKTNEMRTVKQLQFTSWPDYGIPDQPFDLLTFIEEVRKCHEEGDPTLTSPLLLHCSAGVGRTGTFSCIYSAIEEIKGGNGLVEVPGLIRKLRQCRFHMVQRKEQLIFCYQAILCYAQQFLAEEQMKEQARSSARSTTTHTEASLNPESSLNEPVFREDDSSRQDDISQDSIDKQQSDVGPTPVTVSTEAEQRSDSSSDESQPGRERVNSIPKFKVNSDIFAPKSPPPSPGNVPQNIDDKV